ERRRERALAHMALQLSLDEVRFGQMDRSRGPLEGGAAQQLACGVLAHGERGRVKLGRVAGAVRPWRQRLAAHLHSSAPLRHTYTKAISSRTMKTIVSASAKVPKARSSIAIG